MKCEYVHCPNDVPVVKSGKQKKYCSDACKQAAYRQRNPDNDRKRLRKELTAARGRIYALEKFAIQYAPPGYKRTCDVAPATLVEMIRLHGIASHPVEMALSGHVLKPVEEGWLDAEGQATFWQLFNHLPGWHACPECPHGLIP